IGPVGVDGRGIAMTPPLQRLVDGFSTAVDARRLGVATARSRTLDRSPMVKHLRDVADVMHHFGSAEREVIVLRSIEFGSKTAELVEHRLPHGDDVAEICP